MLAAAFLAEGVWVYLIELGYLATAALWLAIGATLALTLARPAARWLAVTVPLALVGELLLSLVYRQAF